MEIHLCCYFWAMFSSHISTLPHAFDSQSIIKLSNQSHCSMSLHTLPCFYTFQFSSILICIIIWSHNFPVWKVLFTLEYINSVYTYWEITLFLQDVLIHCALIPIWKKRKNSWRLTWVFLMSISLKCLMYTHRSSTYFSLIRWRTILFVVRKRMVRWVICSPILMKSSSHILTCFAVVTGSFLFWFVITTVKLNVTIPFVEKNGLTISSRSRVNIPCPWCAYKHIRIHK